MTIANVIDHTLLSPDAVQADIDKMLSEAVQYDFKSVCLQPYWVSYAKQILMNHNSLVCTVIGFPHGATSTNAKIYEASQALEDGADELDMVINIGALKDGHDDLVRKEIRTLAGLAHQKNAILKVIIETSLLTDEEKVRACQIADKAGADFVKTSTGFAGGGASVEDVKLMRESVGPQVKVKASGGVRSYEDARAFLEAGADRLGTSSGVKIAQEESQAN